MIKAEKYIEALKKYKYAVGVLLVGLIFLCWPTGGGESAKSAEVNTAEEDLQATEARMQKILSAIHGVGELEIMLTVDAGEEMLLAKDKALSYSGDTAAPESYTREENFVVISGGSGGEEVVVTQSMYPVYRGALIVCDGGDDPKVRLAVTEAVSALTGLGAEKISVIRKQS